MDIIFLITGLTVGFAAAWFIGKQRFDNKAEILPLQAKLDMTKEKHETALKQCEILKNDLDKEHREIVKLNRELAARNAEYTALEEKLKHQKQEIESLHQKFNDQFSNLAQKILEEKSQKFTRQNKENIDAVLKPLNEKLQDFGKKVEEAYEKNAKDSTSLQTEIKRLYELNNQMSQDANNLTKALKGDVKKQGNWGEMVLEKILERSGLRKGTEYDTQNTFTGEDSRRYKPDVIVYLPQEKHIIVDAKVSLTAYEQFVNADQKEEQDHFAKLHLQSVKNHVKELADKQYHKLSELNAPEYVLMFIPIESSFSVAVKEDTELFNYAWDNKIVIVSPSTLTATLMTIAGVWRQEQQAQNALEIARKSGALYDKFVGLTEDLLNVGNRIKQTQNAYENAMKKLSEGSGNLVKRAEDIKKLGAQTNKSISPALLTPAEKNE